MNKLTIKKLTVTGSLLLITALLASIFSGAGYDQTRRDPGSGCSACTLACTACVACSACTCLSCLGGGLDIEGLTDYDFDSLEDFDSLDDFGFDYTDDDHSSVDSDDGYEAGEYIDLN